MDKTTQQPDPWEQLKEQLLSSMEQAQQSSKEVALLLDQSQTEMAKLTQRNAQVTAHLQQIQAQFDSVPRPDIRNAYKDAMDAQQRLLVMRGQLEKLQSDQSGWLRYVELMKKIEPFLQEERLAKGKRGDTTSLENLINAQEAERQRLSRQMHDGPAQALSNFIVQVEIAARLLDLDPARAKEELAALKTAAMSTFQKVRTFISELRPMMLDDLGVIPTSKRYIDTFREQTGLDVKVDVKGTEKRFENYLEVFVFRGLQELLGTVYRTNQDNPSKVQINVLMIMEDNMVKITVNDNGKGYDPQAMLEGEGLGLKLLKDRVDMLGGTFDIDSAVGKGSRVTMQIPFTSTANA